MNRLQHSSTVLSQHSKCTSALTKAFIYAVCFEIWLIKDVSPTKLKRVHSLHFYILYIFQRNFIYRIHGCFSKPCNIQIHITSRFQICLLKTVTAVIPANSIWFAGATFRQFLWSERVWRQLASRVNHGSERIRCRGLELMGTWWLWWMHYWSGDALSGIMILDSMCWMSGTENNK